MRRFGAGNLLRFLPHAGRPYRRRGDRSSHINQSRAREPLTVAIWGLFVAAALVAGSLPFFVGLAIVFPVLGHATWHLYRKVVSVDEVI